jgi:hypothetical protein
MRNTRTLIAAAVLAAAATVGLVAHAASPATLTMAQAATDYSAWTTASNEDILAIRDAGLTGAPLSRLQADASAWARDTAALRINLESARWPTPVAALISATADQLPGEVDLAEELTKTPTVARFTANALAYRGGVNYGPEIRQLLGLPSAAAFLSGQIPV